MRSGEFLALRKKAFKNFFANLDSFKLRHNGGNLLEFAKISRCFVYVE